MLTLKAPWRCCWTQKVVPPTGYQLQLQNMSGVFTLRDSRSWEPPVSTSGWQPGSGKDAVNSTGPIKTTGVLVGWQNGGARAGETWLSSASLCNFNLPHLALFCMLFPPYSKALGFWSTRKTLAWISLDSCHPLAPAISETRDYTPVSTPWPNEAKSFGSFLRKLEWHRNDADCRDSRGVPSKRDHPKISTTTHGQAKLPQNLGKGHSLETLAPKGCKTWHSCELNNNWARGSSESLISLNIKKEQWQNNLWILTH